MIEIPTDKKSFILYNDYIRYFSKLNTEQIANVMQCIFAFNNGNKEELKQYEIKLSESSSMLWELIQANFEREIVEWIAQKEQREKRKQQFKNANKKRTNEEQIATNNKQQQTTTNNNKQQQTTTNNKMPINNNINIHDNVNANGNENVIVNENVFSKKRKSKEKNNTIFSSLSLNQKKFLDNFPNKEINAELEQNQDIDLLIKAINKSDFLKQADNLSFAWFKKYYNDVIADKYITFTNNKEDFKGRTYESGELNKLFDNIEDIVI